MLRGVAPPLPCDRNTTRLCVQLHLCPAPFGPPGRSTTSALRLELMDQLEHRAGAIVLVGADHAHLAVLGVDVALV